MLTKETQLSRFEINQENKTISIRLDTVIKENDVELSRSCHRTAFVPGQIEDVKAYLGVEDSAEIQYLNSIWTAQVIADYEAMIQAQLDAENP